MLTASAFKAQDQGCLPTQEVRSRKAWKEATTLIESSKWNIQSTGSRSPAHSGGQIKEGLEGTNHADLVFELKVQSVGSRFPARSGKQIEAGVEGASHADWVLELEH